MIDHISIGVSDLARAKAFYDKVLGAIGYQCGYTVDLPDQGVVAHGYHDGKSGKMSFWIGVPQALQPEANKSGGTHIAFGAPSRKAIDDFYKAALEEGGTDNGKPGPRPHYHPDYYGAFVIDPDGNKIEACYRSDRHE